MALRSLELFAFYSVIPCSLSFVPVYFSVCKRTPALHHYNTLQYYLGSQQLTIFWSCWLSFRSSLKIKQNMHAQAESPQNTNKWMFSFSSNRLSIITDSIFLMSFIIKLLSVLLIHNTTQVHSSQKMVSVYCLTNTGPSESLVRA